MSPQFRWGSSCVVHLEFGGLEIPYAKREAPARREWVGVPETGALFSADVAAEQRRHFAFVRAHNEQAAEAEHQQRNKDGARNDEPRRFRPDSVNNGQNRPATPARMMKRTISPGLALNSSSRTTMRRLRKGYLSDIIMDLLCQGTNILDTPKVSPYTTGMKTQLPSPTALNSLRRCDGLFRGCGPRAGLHGRNALGQRRCLPALQCG